MQWIGLANKGLILNADEWFDVNDFRQECDPRGIVSNIDFNPRNRGNNDNYLLDHKLNKFRFSVEELNVWVCGFITQRFRYETKATNCMALHTIAFTLIFLRKFNRIKI
tara:strand:+ start:262 stop:588 length:327 start_codon:yes stop_codon:yes gene_type:complete